MGSEAAYVRVLFLAFVATSSGMTEVTAVQVSHCAGAFASVMGVHSYKG